MTRLLPLAVLVLALMIGGGVTLLPTTGESSSPSDTPTADATLDPSPTAEVTPGATPDVKPAPIGGAKATPAPGPWTAPAGYTGALRPDMWVQITGTDSCLNARVAAGLAVHLPEGDQPVAVLNCLPDGFVGRLGGSTWFGEQEVPQQVDGHWWWHMLGQGWIAEDWLAPVSEEGFPYPQRPELAGAGLIAYISAGSVWVMNADGSAPRMIRELRESSAYITAVRWSPDGSLLAVAADIPGSVDMVVTWVMTPDGTPVAEYPGIMDPTLSPNGRFLSGIRSTQPGGLGGWVGASVVIDRATGAETTIDSAPPTITAPAWSPDSASLAFICWSSSYWEYLPDGTNREVRTECPGGDGLRVADASGSNIRVVLPMSSVAEAYFSNPNWSPDGRSIALSMGGLQAPCQGYGIVSAADGNLLSCFTLPVDYAYGGGCGGSLDGGASDWSLDGRLFVYHWQYRAGENGVAVNDMWSGQRTMIPAMDASNASLATNGAQVVFGGSGYVWVANTDGTGLSLLAEGILPALQPTP